MTAADGSGDRLHAWMFETPDENRAEIEQIGAAKAFIMGRNMFGASSQRWHRNALRNAGYCMTAATALISTSAPGTPNPLTNAAVTRAGSAEASCAAMAP